MSIIKAESRHKLVQIIGKILTISGSRSHVIDITPMRATVEMGVVFERVRLALSAD